MSGRGGTHGYDILVHFPHFLLICLNPALWAIEVSVLPEHCFVIVRNPASDADNSALRHKVATENGSSFGNDTVKRVANNRVQALCFFDASLSAWGQLRLVQSFQ